MNPRSVFFFALTLSLSAGLIAPAVSFADELQGTTTVVCSQGKEKCASISAQKTIPAKIGQLFVLISPELTLEEKGKPSQKISGERGTIDFQQNQIVIAKISGKEIYERSVNLSTFEIKEFRTQR